MIVIPDQLAKREATSFGSLLKLSGGGGATNTANSSQQMAGVCGGPGGETGELNYVAGGIAVGAKGGNSGPYFGG